MSIDHQESGIVFQPGTGTPPTIRENWWAHSQFRRALMISQGLALVMWLGALAMRSAGVFVWLDQRGIFMAGARAWQDPYQLAGWVHPPWAAVLMIPFAALPPMVSIFLQICIYFAALTAVVFKLGGGIRVMVVALSSYFALDAVMQLNMDWMVLIGLLLPLALSGPLVVIKPQLALGYYFGLRVRDWFVVGGPALLFFGVSLLIWGNWVGEIAAKVGSASIGRDFNIAPVTLMPPLLSIIIGLVLAGYAFVGKDPAMGILAWLFFTPYLTPYALPLPHAMLTLRYPRLGLIITLVSWFIIGGTGLWLISRSMLLVQ